MATFDELRNAINALAVAKSDFEAADAAFVAKEAEAVALVPNETAAVNAANEALETALNSARATIGWGAVLDARIAAGAVFSECLQAFRDAFASHEPE